SFTTGFSVTIDANATDSDGTIAKVEFFQGTTKLGEDLTSPYSFEWTPSTEGSYVISAKATDNTGAITVSAEVPVAVTLSAGVTTGINELVASNKIAVFPNPIVDKFTIQYTSPATQEVQVSIIDMAGTLIKQMMVTANAGANDIGFDTNSIYKGIYILVFTPADGHKSTERIVINK
ncbi:MAG TPA: Ig-like domain-containing protein, partial [Cyclobacteriaceae bacterium]|nr:Ig-like domain-containing protein [Cyclobacteriaceae bacterium]